MKYSLSTREIPWAPPRDFPRAQAIFSPYILPLVIIQIQYSPNYFPIRFYEELERKLY